MAGLPPIKPPGDFTGKGSEIIGDPVRRHDQGTLRFKDGIYKSLSFPDFLDYPWTPETDSKHCKEFARDQVGDLAEEIRRIEQLLENPEEIEKIPAAILELRNKINLPEFDWKDGPEELRARWNIDALKVELQKLRLELQSLMPTRSKKNDSGRKRFLEREAQKIAPGGFRSDWPAQKRRPHAALIALIESARELRRPPPMAYVVAKMKTFRDEKGFLAAGEDDHLIEVIEKLGFAWLERRPRGRQSAR